MLSDYTALNANTYQKVCHRQSQTQVSNFIGLKINLKFFYATYLIKKIMKSTLGV
jgi:hypothetical protein